MTDGGQVRKACGSSPFAGIARIRSLGVAVQPGSWPASRPSGFGSTHWISLRLRWSRRA